MDLLPKSDSPHELAGGKTGRRECREADAGWSRSRGRREDREMGVRGGGRWPEPSPENGGGRWDGRSRWKDGMRDVAGRRASGDDRLPGRKTEPELEKEGSRRKRRCREGDAGRSGSRRRREERERRDLREGDAGWSRSRRRREGRRRKTEVQSEGRLAGRKTRCRRKTPVAGEGRREVLGSSRWKTRWEEAKMAFAPWGGRKAFALPRRTGLDVLTALMALTPVSHQCAGGKRQMFSVLNLGRTIVRRGKRAATISRTDGCSCTTDVYDHFPIKKKKI